MGLGCIFHDRIEAGVLAARQQPCGEGTLRVSSPAPAPPALIGDGRDAIFMNRDVVEFTQAILHVLQRREKLLPTLRHLLPREKAGEELRCVSHLLRLNAQLVTAAGIEPGEHFALLADLLEAARQLVGGGNLDGDITTIADEVVLRSPPLPCLQPAGDLERQRAKALRLRRILRARAAARCCVRSRERPEMPCNRECRRFTGATTRVTSTSSSRAGPSSPVSHLSSSLSAADCGSCKTSANSDIAARSRRKPTRIWCTPSGSSASSAGTLSITCLRHASPMALKASRVLVPRDRSMGAAFTGAASAPSSSS